MTNNAIKGNFKNKDIISLDQFSTSDLLTLFKTTKKIKKAKSLPKSLKDKIVTLLFFEPSSRTYGSFSASVKKLGGNTIDVLDPQKSSSVSKGETFEDTIKVFECYSDAIVIRHPEVGFAKKAAEVAAIPIINAGDGIGEHPTQALLDLYTLYEHHGKLDNLTGVIAGDLLNGRTIHSLIRGLSKFKNNKLYLLSPRELKLKHEQKKEFEKYIKLVEIESDKDIPKNANFWYWTRVQKERFEKLKDYELIKNKFIVSKELLNKYADINTIILHPLPRVGEILEEVDSDPRAFYLKTQIKNGIFVRMALLKLILEK
jgi:aspartate carbamoyltransferase catalytic subunit